MMPGLPPAAPAPSLPTGRPIACPHCDALYREAPLATGERWRCGRCGTVLSAPRAGAFVRVAALSLAALVLMLGAAFLPFLSVSQMGFSHGTSVFRAALAFKGGLAPLSVAVLAFIVLLPLLRFAGLVYVTAPLAFRRRPLPGAARVYRLTEDLRPWSMAEVFTIGTVIALVKMAGSITVNLGPAFWAFVAMIVALALAETQIDRWSIWRALERSGAT